MNTITSHTPPPTPKGKEGHKHAKPDQRPRKTHTINRMSNSFPTRWSFSYSIENGSNIYFYLFSILSYKTEQNRKHNGQLIFSYHIAEDHIHTDITCNTEEPQQKYRLGTVSNRLMGGGLLRVLLDPNPRPQLLQ